MTLPTLIVAALVIVAAVIAFFFLYIKRYGPGLRLRVPKVLALLAICLLTTLPFAVLSWYLWPLEAWYETSIPIVAIAVAALTPTLLVRLGWLWVDGLSDRG